jgi:hypothetical protein
MTSLEKIQRFKEALVRSPEEMDGLLGALQATVSIAELKGVDLIGSELGDDPATIDEGLLEVVAFVLWLRSDDAPAPDLEDLAGRMPVQIAAIVEAAGIA